jgi:serralysin
MATPFDGTEGIFSSLSSDSRVNALLVGSQWANTALTYSFITPLSTFSTSTVNGYGPSTNTSREPWSPSLSYFGGSSQQAASSAIAKWGAVSNLTFSLVADAQNVCGDIRFGFTDVGGAQAAAYSPSAAAGGDVWFNYLERARNFEEGSYNYLTLVHEIGHALGLKHPFSASTNNMEMLPPSLDTQTFTVMSYSAQAEDRWSDFTYRPTTPMVLDIQAIQYLYGANWSYNAGATEYVFRQGAQYHQTVWDGGGLDTFVYSGADACVIDLRQGSGSALGNPVYVVDLLGNRKGTVSNVWIAKGAVIENATGGEGSDSITGNDLGNGLLGAGGNDTLRGWGGNDRIDGGTGDDKILFTGNLEEYTVTFNPETGRFAVGDDSRVRDGIDVVSSVEVFQFANGIRTGNQLPLSSPVTGISREVLGMSEGLFGQAPDVARFLSAYGSVAEVGGSAFAIGVGASFASSDHAALATRVLSNFGIAVDTLGGGAPELSYSALLDALRVIFDVYPESVGQVVLNVVNLLGSLESNSVYGVAAATFNNRLAGDYDTLYTAIVGVPPPPAVYA